MVVAGVGTRKHHGHICANVVPKENSRKNNSGMPICYRKHHGMLCLGVRHATYFFDLYDVLPACINQAFFPTSQEVLFDFVVWCHKKLAHVEVLPVQILKSHRIHHGV